MARIGEPLFKNVSLVKYNVFATLRSRHTTKSAPHGSTRGIDISFKSVILVLATSLGYEDIHSNGPIPLK